MKKRKLGRKLLGVLLTLAMVVGLMPGMSLTAYADNTEELLTTLTFGGSSTYSETTSGVVSVTATNVTSYNDTYGWLFFDVGSLSVTAEEGYTINKCVFRQNNKQPITDTEAPFEIHFSDGCCTEDTNWDMDGVTSIEVYRYVTPTTVDVAGVSLNKTTTTLTVGDTETLTATVSPDDATDKTVKWSVGGTNADAVKLYTDAACTTEVGTDATSTLTVYAKGISAGSATVTAASNADNSKNAECAVTVNKADPTAPTGLTATYGQTLANVMLPAGWTWADSTQSVGSVVSTAATFKANFAGDDNYNAASNVDVTVTVSKADATAAMQAASVSIAGTSGKTATVSYTLPDGASYGAVTNSNTEFFTVDTTSGIVLTAAKNWTASDWATDTSKTFTVLVSGATNYNDYTLTVTVTPTYKATQTITAADVTATYGDTGKKIEASTSGDGALSYSVKSGDAVTVDASGNLTIVKAGTAVITVTAAETGTYAQATKEVTVTINKANAVPATVTANNRTYDGTEKSLVTVTGEPMGGTMYYALGENSTTAPADNLYTTSIPAKTNAGTYYVWYKAVGDETHTDSEAKCITVTISSESSGGGGGSSSSGGSSSAPSAPTTPTESYTVPVSSENTVNVTANISNGTAVVSEITQSDIDKIVDNGNNSGGGDNTGASENTSITIDVSQAKSEVTSVQLSEKTVEKLTEAVKADNNVESVEIKMTNATIELDGAALSAVSEQAEGSSIKLVVEDTQTTKLNATQQESLRQFASAKPFQAYFESNGKEIHDFKGGKATVSIKFSPESGRDVKHYHMYYLPVAGAIERYVTRYVDGMLSFVTTHFSDYAIVYDETMENETGKDDGTGGGSSETGGESNGNTANGKTTYQNAISINKGLKVSQTGSKINVSWGKVSGADRYEIYAAYCTGKFGKTPVKVVTKKGVTSVTITKLNGKKIELTKNFKVYVAAYKTVDGVKKKLGKTITAHIVGRKNKTYTNVKAIKLAKNKATIKVGKTYKIKASVVLVDSKKKMLSDKHAATFRYASSDKKIATVDKNGKVTAKKKGTCYVWIYAKNGYANKVKVTVK